MHNLQVFFWCSLLQLIRFARSLIQSSRPPTATIEQFGEESKNDGHACQRCDTNIMIIPYTPG